MDAAQRMFVALMRRWRSICAAPSGGEPSAARAFCAAAVKVLCIPSAYAPQAHKESGP
jgi:hypothetical protein